MASQYNKLEKLGGKKSPIEEEKTNTHNIILNVNEIGLNRFKKVPTFKNLLHSNQLNDLKIGDNKLTVNNTVWGKLQQMVGSDSSNMSVKKENIKEETNVSLVIFSLNVVIDISQ